MTTGEQWTVWGDQAEPVLEGTEEECKKYVVDRPNEVDLYVTDPSGNEWIYNDTREIWKIDYEMEKHDRA